MSLYIASKSKHGPRWRALRASGVAINSTWIDESGEGETSDWEGLWRRCIAEATGATAVILYCEPGEILKGAYVEVGAALAFDVPVFVVGEPAGSFWRHRLVTRCETMEIALRLASVPYAPAARGELPNVPCTACDLERRDPAFKAPASSHECRPPTIAEACDALACLEETALAAHEEEEDGVVIQQSTALVRRFLDEVCGGSACPPRALPIVPATGDLVPGLALVPDATGAASTSIREILTADERDALVAARGLTVGDLRRALDGVDDRLTVTMRVETSQGGLESEVSACVGVRSAAVEDNCGGRHFALDGDDDLEEGELFDPDEDDSSAASNDEEEDESNEGGHGAP